jgi:propanediol dehydratase small subunit
MSAHTSNEAPRYPLMESAGDELKATSGKPVSAITLDAVAAGEIASADLQIGAETLRAQAEIATRAGYPEVAANLVRAAELTAVPNGELLRMYEKMRPGRSTYEEMIDMATTLAEQYGAVETAAFVREAAEVYRARNLLRRP